jgi:thiol-disulfide isomerase/thioredoxin
MSGCSSEDSGDSAPVAESTAQATGQTGGADGSNGTQGGGAAAPAGQDDKAAAGPADSQPGQYVDYSPELLSSTPGEKLLFFHAPWCSQCQALDEDIESSGVPDGVTIFKVDYDSNQDLRQQYGVTIQTTMVKVDDNGEKIDSYVAYEDPTLENVSTALLDQ